MRPTAAVVESRPPSRLLTAAALWVALAAATVAPAADLFLELDASGLEDLGAGWAYEGWLIADGVPVSTGTFTVDAMGAPSPSRFSVEVRDADAVSAFVLTIEPEPDADPAPSAVHVLAGDFHGAEAMLSAGHPAALGDDFSTSAGSYILAAPSGGDGSDYRNGIWWLDPDGGPDPALDLPTLPTGWAYEGWVVGPAGPMSTGRFAMASGSDSDAGGLTAGPYPTPPFPGQDLLNPPTDLTDGYAAVISIEPVPDNSPAPFAFKPLVDRAIDDVGEAGILQSMANTAADFPTATVRLHETSRTAELAHLRLELTGLEDLGSDFVYEGWLIVDGSPVSTGRFTVDGGVPSQSYFPTAVGSLDAVSAFVLTIEPAEGDDPAPSAVHLLGGDVVAGSAPLTIGHGAALGTDFADVAGGYILAAPSSGGAAPYRNGIWWLDPGAGPGPSLVLPELPEGWVYEGWIAGADGPISTGRFQSPSGEDSDGAGPSAGPEAGPPFPGQDFVDPALDLTAGYAAVISVEPEPDTSAAPFSLKPLLDPSIDDVGEGVLQPMGRNSAGIPAGTAVLLAEQYIAAAAHTGGSNETVWRTDLDLHNATSRFQPTVVELLRSDQSNQDPMRRMLTLAPQSSVRLVDVIDSLFGTDGVGALRILSEAGTIHASSRTYNDAFEGSFGQGIPGRAPVGGLGYGDLGRLVGLSASGSSDAGFRTNIGLVNLGLDPVTIQIDLFDGNGGHLDRVTRTLAAFEHTQVNGIFPTAADTAFAEAATNTPGGSFLVYGSVVDNRTGDPTYVEAR